MDRLILPEKEVIVRFYKENRGETSYGEKQNASGEGR